YNSILSHPDWGIFFSIIGCFRLIVTVFLGVWVYLSYADSLDFLQSCGGADILIFVFGYAILLLP
ncbi:MAG: hypothetical protein ACI9NC_004854, partial [Verrucomicrobiales bacterium]